MQHSVWTPIPNPPTSQKCNFSSIRPPNTAAWLWWPLLRTISWFWKKNWTIPFLRTWWCYQLASTRIPMSRIHFVYTIVCRPTGKTTAVRNDPYYGLRPHHIATALSKVSMFVKTICRGILRAQKACYTCNLNLYQRNARGKKSNRI